jgi:PAS domain-containing protein
MAEITAAPRGDRPAAPPPDPSRVLDALSAALFEANHDLVWDFATDGRVRGVNPRIGPVLGYDAA